MGGKEGWGRWVRRGANVREVPQGGAGIEGGTAAEVCVIILAEVARQLWGSRGHKMARSLAVWKRMDGILQGEREALWKAGVEVVRQVPGELPAAGHITSGVEHYMAPAAVPATGVCSPNRGGMAKGDSVRVWDWAGGATSPTGDGCAAVAGRST